MILWRKWNESTFICKENLRKVQNH